MPSSYLNALNEEGTREDLLREVKRLYEDNARLREKIAAVLGTFIKDEEQGYRSKDRQFAISILKGE